MPVVRANEGAVLRVMSDEIQLKVPSSASPYLMSVVVVEVPPGSFLPPSFHQKEEEIYFVLEGYLDLTLEGKKVRLKPGDLAHIPPRTPHGYENLEPVKARFLAWSVGGPLDEFFGELAQNVKSMPADAEKLVDAMNRYGIVPAT